MMANEGRSFSGPNLGNVLLQATQEGRDEKENEKQHIINRFVSCVVDEYEAKECSLCSCQSSSSHPEMLYAFGEDTCRGANQVFEMVLKDESVQRKVKKQLFGMGLDTAVIPDAQNPDFNILLFRKVENSTYIKEGCSCQGKLPLNEDALRFLAMWNENVYFASEMDPPTNLMEVLNQIRISQISVQSWKRELLVTVDESCTISEACNLLNENKILSLPVVDSNGYISTFFDTIDLVKGAVSLYGDDENDTVECTRMKTRFLSQTVKDVLAVTENKVEYLVSTKTCLIDVVRTMLSAPVTRVLLVDRGGIERLTTPSRDVIGVLTHTDIIRFLAQNINWLKREPFFQQSLSDISTNLSFPSLIKWNFSYLDMLRTVVKCNSSGVGVVSSTGKLLASISSSSIKAYFLDLDMNGKTHQIWHVPDCAMPHQTIESLILQFGATKLHRMYVVNQYDKPTNEVTVSDILYIVYKYYSYYSYYP